MSIIYPDNYRIEDITGEDLLAYLKDIHPKLDNDGVPSKLFDMLSSCMQIDNLNTLRQEIQKHRMLTSLIHVEENHAGAHFTFETLMYISNHGKGRKSISNFSSFIEYNHVTKRFHWTVFFQNCHNINTLVKMYTFLPKYGTFSYFRMLKEICSYEDFDQVIKGNEFHWKT